MFIARMLNANCLTNLKTKTWSEKRQNKSTRKEATTLRRKTIAFDEQQKMNKEKKLGIDRMNFYS